MNDLNIKKRLLYRSAHRGCKETDILLGNFAISELDSMSDLELKTYEKLLEVDDVDIYNWLTEKAQIPAEYDNSVLNKIKVFNKK